MGQTRREFLRGVVGWGGLAVAGSLQLRAVRMAEPIRRAHRFLEGAQSPDGAWRSSRYAAFREGDVLTPVVLWALLASPGAQHGDPVIAHGLAWLRQWTDRCARTEAPTMPQLHYPLFAASYAAQVLMKAGEPQRAQVWTSLLERLRTSEALGWPAGDSRSGAWSDAVEPPRYVTPIPDMLAPNISATALAAMALRSAGKDPRAAFPFIASCQNFAAEGVTEFDDGGFFFTPGDPIRNKAGREGIDGRGVERFCSYGSATCDGYLALRACGLPRDDARVLAAKRWLEQNAEGIYDRATWAVGRGEARASLAFYFCQAWAGVLGDWKGAAAKQLKERLEAGLIRCQEADGSWIGEAPDSCEDEPVLATAFAMRALALTA